MKTMSRAAPLLVLALACAAFAAACGDETPDPNEGGCTTDPRADTYVAGLEKQTSGSLKVRLMSATPQPPDRGDNQWTFEVVDASGAAVEGATVRVRPWMPDHGHGSTPERFDATPAAGGTYAVGPVNLFMPGLWELEVRIEPEGGGAVQTAKYAFCVEG